MKWEIELNQKGIGTVKCDGVDISKDVVGCHMTASPNHGTVLYLELRAGIRLTLNDPEIKQVDTCITPDCDYHKPVDNLPEDEDESSYVGRHDTEPTS